MMTGLILAGGFSRRLGQDKAFLPWQGQQTLLEHQVSQLQGRVDRLVVLGGSGAVQAYCQNCGIAFFRDEPRGQGPARAIVAWLQEQQDPLNLLFVAVDLPFVIPQLDEVTGVLSDSDGRLALAGKVVCDCYSADLEAFMESQERAFHQLAKGLGWPVVQVENSVLFNINTMDDYCRALSKMGV